MTNTALMVLIAMQVAALIAIYVVHRRLGRNTLIVLAAVFIITGIGMIFVTEFVYSTANTRALDTTLNLARPGRIVGTDFTTGLSGRYDLFLQTDHTPGIAKFGCLTGDAGFEPLCPKGDPELETVWTVSDQGAAVARGGSDIEGWRARQAALNPAEAARRRAAYLADMAKVENPSDVTPLFHSLGGFEAKGGHTYALSLELRRAAPTLGAAHPRLLVGYSGTQTRGLGLLVILFCLIGVAGGGAMILVVRDRQARAA
jgi:hypothetical protein